MLIRILRHENESGACRSCAGLRLVYRLQCGPNIKPAQGQCYKIDSENDYAYRLDTEDTVVHTDDIRVTYG